MLRSSALSRTHVRSYLLGLSRQCRKVSCNIRAQLIQTYQELAAKQKDPAIGVSFSDWAPSWNELDQLLRLRRQEQGIPEPDYETGPTNYYASRRTFGKDDKIRVKLYRDLAAWCPFCHMLTFYLEQRQIPYEVEQSNMKLYGRKKPEYLKKVPSGLFPAIELDGELMLGTADIIAKLEGEKDLSDIDLSIPEDEEFSQRVQTVFSALVKTNAEWLKSTDDYTDRMTEVCDDIEEIMSENEGDYIWGKNLCLEDVRRSPFLLRTVALCLYFKDFKIRSTQWPNLLKWFEAMETHDAYVGTMSDFYSYIHGMQAQYLVFEVTCQFSEDNKQIAAVVNGKDGGWQLPLLPLSQSTFEPYTPRENPSVDKIQAAARMIDNYDNVVRFASRACGVGEKEAVIAPLSNPYAIPEHVEEVDSLLRQVVYVLLNDYATLQLPHKTQGKVYSDSCGLLGLEYLRDRVSVPRDLRFPAARQLRAHINWIINRVQQQ